MGGDKGGKKQEKKKEKKVSEPAEEEEVLALPEMPKKEKDPFAAVPKGNFDFDDFKRFYSNNDEEKSIPYFWEKLDKENYSIGCCAVTTSPSNSAPIGRSITPLMTGRSSTPTRTRSRNWWSSTSSGRAPTSREGSSTKARSSSERQTCHNIHRFDPKEIYGRVLL